ncbi:hypothetical protein BDA99DRAFT_532691 [Phascolomyces articulosus]|uniref:Uncharacterized protein n=1 Tax=Phascolomyces articulosus TaxID=60185 RepID=A0AAD5PIQ9_9FUNG|nr:hypothetical protein BDA99DRAFT_532691 [Phascolomyces articulosus]
MASPQSLKTKWSHFMTRFNPDEEQQQLSDEPIINTSRRPSHVSHVSSSCSTIAEDTFWSDSMSTISEQSTSTNNKRNNYPAPGGESSSRPRRTAKRHLLHLFRRRGSSLDDTDYFDKEKQRLHSLYELALDEIKYAEDSRGSPYYVGDRITAREAIDGCATAFMNLQQQTTDTSLQSLLQSTMAPRLIELQTKFDALPLEQQ